MEGTLHGLQAHLTDKLHCSCGGETSTRLLPYDPTGIALETPLHVRLKYLQRELKAYTDVVIAEAKLLKGKRRVIPEGGVEETADTEPPEVEIPGADLDVHPPEEDENPPVGESAAPLETKEEGEKKHK